MPLSWSQARNNFFENEDDSPLLVTSIDGISTQVRTALHLPVTCTQGPRARSSPLPEDPGPLGGLGGLGFLGEDRGGLGSTFSLFTPSIAENGGQFFVKSRNGW